MKKINNFIETPISQDILIPIGQYLIIPLIILCITYVFVQKGIEKYKHENENELEKEIYVREVTAKQKEWVLAEWSSLVMAKEALEKYTTKKYEELFLKTTMYGDERTIKLATLFQQTNYKGKNISEKWKSDKQKWKTYVFLSMIVCSIRKDYSDVQISPQTLMALKLTDYDKMKKELVEIETEIENELKQYNKNLEGIQ